jgi:lysozyme family protein
MDIAKLKAANAKRWAAAKLTRGPEFGPVASRLVANKARFQAMEARTGVPWFVIAVIKERESGADPQWLKSIAQGQPWNKVSTIVPKGRGPFKSWEEAAYDALVNCPPYAARNKDWSIGGILTLLEGYNGYGYAQRGLPSPYVWSGTDQYKSGKYVADHVFDPNVVDKQLGCAGLILAMQAIDPTIRFEAPKPAVTPSDAGKAGGGAVVAGTVAAGVQQGWTAWQWGLLGAAVVAVGVIGYFAWRWWKHYQTQPEPYHDTLLAVDKAKSSGALAALPAPAEMWKASKKPTQRKGAKTRAKPKAKRKTTKKRKAA